MLAWISAVSNVVNQHPWLFAEAPTDSANKVGELDVPVENGFRGNLVEGKDQGTVTIHVRYSDADGNTPPDFTKTVTIKRNGVCNEPKKVGGTAITVDKFGLLAPYIGLASTAMIGAVATVAYVRRAKRREKKQ